MRFNVACGMALAALATSVSNAQQSWIITNYTLQDGPFTQVTGGGYQNANWHYSSGQGIQRAFWKFDFPDVPSIPRLYLVEQFIPTNSPVQLGWLPIEVTFRTDCNTCEEATNNPDIPWGGQFGTNHQWLGMEQDGTPGQFQQAGPGPQAPANNTCAAPGNGQFVWMQKGSTLYTKWDFGFFPPPHAITALRITEAAPLPPPPGCGPAVFSGPIDLRCVGNADPLYATGEFYSTAIARTVDGNALGVDGYVKPTCFTPNPSLLLGLPPNGQYTAHLPADDVSFQLRYDGFNTIKWRNEVGGDFSKANVFTLNEVAGREFSPGPFKEIHVLSVKGGGSNGTLIIEAVYSDNSVQSSELNLYDWFNQSGDADSVAVGINGNPRSEGDTGFRRLNDQGASGNGGDTSGAFPIAHSVTINHQKTLKQIRLKIGDLVGFGGELCVVAVTAVAGLPCNTPVFDVAGGGPGGDQPDGAVDQQDFGAFQACVTGPSPAPGVFDFVACGCFDINNDEAITNDDLTYFENCATGPTPIAPPPLDCDKP